MQACGNFSSESKYSPFSAFMQRHYHRKKKLKPQASQKGGLICEIVIFHTRLIYIFRTLLSEQDLAPFPKEAGCQRVTEPVSHLFFINRLLKDYTDLMMQSKTRINSPPKIIFKKYVKKHILLKSGLCRNDFSLIS